MQNGPRDLDAVLAARYWLTDKGWATAHDLDTTTDTTTPEETPTP